MNNPKGKPVTRPATLEDIVPISRLCGQLGYPAGEDEVKQRLETILPDENHLVCVAEVDSRIIGWVQVQASYLVVAGRIAQVTGLVVDEKCRRAGVGKLLMQKAEEWARKQGCSAVYIQSNIIREEAHGFYGKIGYESLKTQYQFRKVLSRER